MGGECVKIGIQAPPNIHTCAHGQELEAVESIPTIGHGGELAPLLSPTIPTKSLSAWIHMSTNWLTRNVSGSAKSFLDIVHETRLQVTCYFKTLPSHLVARRYKSYQRN